MAALCENVRSDSRLVIQQGTFVRIGRWRVHARAEVDEHALVGFFALDDDRRRIGTEPRRMHEILRGENADLRGPLERRECLIER